MEMLTGAVLSRSGWNAPLTFPALAFNYLWIATSVAIQ